MIEALIFSKDRPAQLDLLLRSLASHSSFSRLFSPTVLFAASTEISYTAYEVLMREHEPIEFLLEADDCDSFECEVYDFLAVDRPVMFLCDDDVFLPDRPGISTHGPRAALTDSEEILAFSLRLGRNTTQCYPMRRPQSLPKFVHRWASDDRLCWNWLEAADDFGYPCSLDGHVMRSGDVRLMLGGTLVMTPNELEEQLARRARTAMWHRPLMASYAESVLVGVPVNLVNTTHRNRHGESHPFPAEELIDRFLNGQRIDYEATMRGVEIVGAHQELPLVFTSAPVC